MQLIQEERDFSRAYIKIIAALSGLIWVGGLLMAGSDGPYMPWLNIFGALMFFCASLVLGRVLPQVDNKNRVRDTPARMEENRFKGKTMTPKVARMGRPGKINTRVALGV